ncbi:MAG: hypothetical protein K2Y22_06025 [Candidatus Obscuribacterales bacterium]|nr:hypothetical protein [Candidatus Obscuribacterales bacterium]
MFGKELGQMIGLLNKVLTELKTSNETQKQLLAAIQENTKAVKLQVIQKLETADAPTEGNIYRGDETSSHKGDCKSKKEEGASDCRSKCNGRCDNQNQSGSQPWSTNGNCSYGGCG